MDSILNTVKLALGVEADYNGFDTNILLDINSALSYLNQLGVGKSGGLIVKGEAETWEEFLGENTNIFESAKTYVLHKVRLSFDPPSNSFLVDAIEKQIKELEWRLMVLVETPTYIYENIPLSKKGGLSTPVYEPGQETWFLQDGLFLADCEGAYNAVSAASYAASKVNLANPGIHDLNDYGNPPTWTSGFGWIFNPPNSTYLDPDIYPNSQYSIICRYQTGYGNSDKALFGLDYPGSSPKLYFMPQVNLTNNNTVGLQKTVRTAEPQCGVNDSVVAISGDGKYYHSDGGLNSMFLIYTAPIDPWDNPGLKLLLGCLDLWGDSPYYFIGGYMKSLAIYNKPLTQNQLNLILTHMP